MSAVIAGCCSTFACGAILGIPDDRTVATSDASHVGDASVRDATREAQHDAAFEAQQDVAPEAHRDTAPPIDSATDHSPATDTGLDGATVCDFSGTWAVKVTFSDVSWGGTASVAAATGQTVTQWSRRYAAQDTAGLNLSGSLTPCGIDLPDLTGTVGTPTYGLRLPFSLFDHYETPAATYTATLGGTSPGTSYGTSQTLYYWIGLFPFAQSDETWPVMTGVQQEEQADQDRDGKPGVTLTLAVGPVPDGGTYANFPTGPVGGVITPPADRLYYVHREGIGFQGMVSTCNLISGSVNIPNDLNLTPMFNQGLVGCHLAGDAGDCNDAETAFVALNMPTFTIGSATFQEVRISEGASCSDTRNTAFPPVSGP